MRKLFPDKEYINLENPDLRELARSDPRAFLQKIKQDAILDEIQRAPDILSYL
ncbi:MAG: AAA family ATPase, partial [Actinobacteria bacterium]|nr:AAA family ATPase [Actinomycetota bacterium]